MANNIAMGFQGIQLPDPLNAYAKVMSIQNAQNQNALAQYQMASAQRADADQNQIAAMARAPGGINAENVNQLLGMGAAGKSTYESYLKGDKDKREGAKAQTDLVDAKLKQSRSFLDTVSTPEQYIAWHQANHADPVLGPVLAARGITAEQSMGRIRQALSTPGGLETLLNQSKLGTEKFMEMNKPHFVNQTNGATNQTLSIPGMGGPATVVPGSVSNVTSTPHQLALEAQSAQNTGIAAQRLDLDRQKAEQVRINPEGLSPKDMAKREVAFPQSRLAITTLDQKTNDLVKNLEELKAHRGLSNITGGVMGRIGSVSDAGTGAQSLLNTVLARGQVGVMLALKEASKTGSTGFGALSEKEGKVLRDTFGVLDQTQSTDDFKKRIDDVIEQVKQSRDNMRQSFEDTYSYKAARQSGESATTSRDTVDLATINREIARVKPSETGRLEILNQEKREIQKRVNASAGAPAATRSPVDQQALEWASANPSDPRAAQIKSRLGVK